MTYQQAVKEEQRLSRQHLQLYAAVRPASSNYYSCPKRNSRLESRDNDFAPRASELVFYQKWLLHPEEVGSGILPAPGATRHLLHMQLTPLHTVGQLGHLDVAEAVHRAEERLEPRDGRYKDPEEQATSWQLQPGVIPVVSSRAPGRHLAVRAREVNDVIHSSLHCQLPCRPRKRKRKRCGFALLKFETKVDTKGDRHYPPKRRDPDRLRTD